MQLFNMLNFSRYSPWWRFDSVCHVLRLKSRLHRFGVLENGDRFCSRRFRIGSMRILLIGEILLAGILRFERNWKRKIKKGLKLSGLSPFLILVAREGIELPFYGFHAPSRIIIIILTIQYVSHKLPSWRITEYHPVSSKKVDQ